MMQPGLLIDHHAHAAPREAMKRRFMPFPKDPSGWLAETGLPA